MKVAALFRRSVRLIALLLTIAALAFYVIVGHAAHDRTMALSSMHGAGICMMLIALAGATIALVRSPHVTVRLPSLVRVAIPRSPAIVVDVNQRTRASPIWLQRFLH